VEEVSFGFGFGFGFECYGGLALLVFCCEILQMQQSCPYICSDIENTGQSPPPFSPNYLCSRTLNIARDSLLFQGNVTC
jgi:hypothetical protein